MIVHDFAWWNLPGGVAVLMTALAACPAGGVAAEPVYLPVDSNIAYSLVESLPTGTPTTRLSYGDDPLQYGDLWLPAPATADEPAPLIVFVHGGCWLNAYDAGHTSALSTALTQAGFAVWSLEYRRTGDAGGGWPGTFDDIMAGLAYVESLTEYPIVTDQFVIAGHSAGGHLALLAGGRLPEARAVIGLAAITDIAAYSLGENSCQTATPLFMGGSAEEKPADYRAANPAMQPRHANTLLLHGSADEIVPPEQVQLPGAIRIIEPDAGHFDWVHPGTRSFQTLLSTLQRTFAE